jgi:hypothetical protein
VLLLAERATEPTAPPVHAPTAPPTDARTAPLVRPTTGSAVDAPPPHLWTRHRPTARSNIRSPVHTHSTTERPTRAHTNRATTGPTTGPLGHTPPPNRADLPPAHSGTHHRPTARPAPAAPPHTCERRSGDLQLGELGPELVDRGRRGRGRLGGTGGGCGERRECGLKGEPRRTGAHLGVRIGEPGRPRRRASRPRGRRRGRSASGPGRAPTTVSGAMPGAPLTASTSPR